VLGELLAFSSGEVLVTHTTSGWFSGWLEGKRGSTAPTTFMKYRQVIGDFLTYLGKPDMRRAAPLSLHGRSVISMLLTGNRRTEHGLAVKFLHSVGIRRKGRSADILLP
jgi:hypothetical protein